MIFDTHSHCYFEKLAPKIDLIHANMLASWVTHSVQIWCDLSSSLAAIELARKFDNWYATVGYHPVDAQNPMLSKDRAWGKSITLTESHEIQSDIACPKAIENWLRKLAFEHRDMVVAIWETGLDQYHLSEDPTERAQELQLQYYWFERLAIMAQDLDLPLVIHSRNARRETIDAIKKFQIQHAVIHCFSEDIGFARELMEFSEGIYFSFSGILTYPNAQEIQEAAKQIPLDRILIETDAPFLSPQAVRGTINEPANTKLVLEFLTSIRSETPEQIEKQVFENSLAFYRINDTAKLFQ